MITPLFFVLTPVYHPSHLQFYFCITTFAPKTLKKLFGETLIYGMGAILPRVITFILNPILVYYIRPDDFAIFTNLYAWIAYINVLLTFGFETAFFRFSAEKEHIEKTFHTSFWFIFALALSFLVLVLAFGTPLSALMQYTETPEYLRWFAWIAFLDAITVIPFAWLRFHNKPIIYSTIRLSSVLVHFFALLALLVYIPRQFSENFGLKNTVSFPFITNLLGSITMVILLLPVLKKIRWQFDFQLFKRMIHYSVPIVLAGFAFQVNENWDKLVQIYQIPTTEAGAYGGCYKLAVLMTLFVTAYRMGIEPYFFKQMNTENAKEKYATVTFFFTLFASVIAMSIIANIEWLKWLFIRNESYWLAIDIVPIIIIANLFFGIYYNLSTWYKVTDRTWMGTIFSSIGAFITISIHFFFLKKYGFIVSAWATFFAYFIMMVGSYFLGQKFYKIPYKTTKISSYLAILLLLSFIQVYYFKYSIISGNLFFLFFLGTIAIGEQKFIRSLFRRIKK